MGRGLKEGLGSKGFLRSFRPAGERGQGLMGVREGACRKVWQQMSSAQMQALGGA